MSSPAESALLYTSFNYIHIVKHTLRVFVSLDPSISFIILYPNYVTPNLTR
jgi:hypothetical protein